MKEPNQAEDMIVDEFNPLHDFVRALARRQARLDYAEEVRETREDLSELQPSLSLQNKLIECRRQLELYQQAIDAIEAAGEQIQSRLGIDAPWVDCTVVTLAQRKLVKTHYESMASDLERRIASGET